MCLATIMLSAEGVLTPYMNVHFWGLTTEQISTIPAFSMFGLIIGFMITPLLTRWLDKKKTLMYCSMLAIVNPVVLVGPAAARRAVVSRQRLCRWCCRW